MASQPCQGQDDRQNSADRKWEVARHRRFSEVWDIGELRVSNIPSIAHCPPWLFHCISVCLIANTAYTHIQYRKFNIPHWPHPLKWKLVPGNSYVVSFPVPSDLSCHSQSDSVPRKTLKAQ